MGNAFVQNGANPPQCFVDRIGRRRLACRDLLNRLIAPVVALDHCPLSCRQFLQTMPQRVLSIVRLLLSREDSLVELFHDRILQQNLSILHFSLEIADVVVGETARPGKEIESGIVPLPVLPKRQTGLLKQLLRIRAARDQRNDIAKNHILASHKPLSELLMFFRVHVRLAFLPRVSFGCIVLSLRRANWPSGTEKSANPRAMRRNIRCK